MSRLIVKNLPNKIKEERVRDIFSQQGGEITDIKLCFTKAGLFRKFGFVGFKQEDEAIEAQKFLNRTFIDTSRIVVDVCKSLGDQSVPRPWSKHSEGSSAFSKKGKTIEDRKSRVAQLQQTDEAGVPSKKKPVKESSNDNKSEPESVGVLSELKEMEDNEEFQEFLQVHQKTSTKKTWLNETANQKAPPAKEKANNNDDKAVMFEGDDASEDEDEDEDGDEDTDEDDIDEPEVKEEDEDNSSDEDAIEEKDSSIKSSVNDSDWLKSKVTKTKGEVTSDLASTTDVEQTTRLNHSTPVSDEVDDKAAVKDDEAEDDVIAEDDAQQQQITLKLRGIPFKCTEQEVIAFFKKRAITDIRFPLNKDGKRSGYAFVDFADHKQLLKAMKRNGKKLGSRYIELFPIQNSPKEKDDHRPWANKAVDPGDPVSDSGRIFIRNLAFTCSADDLEGLFSRFGTLAEVHLPVNKSNNKTVGYAFVSFEHPEHAVCAFNELDGSVFQGRMIHLIPAKPAKQKDEESSKTGGTSSFKSAKEATKKSLSASSHNWNALFLAPNAVADVMASKMKTSKSELLNTVTANKSDAGNSVAVRMALGETEVVTETREFLESNGVKLDVFGQACSARSKEVLLVKNLPAGTSASELQDLFAPFGHIGRLLLPPFGISAIIEYLNAADAKKAFTNLAYSKFKHTPLYLEWAPIDALSAAPENVQEKKESEEKIAEDVEEDSEDDGETEQAVLFVKNLKFETTEDAILERFASCGKVKSVTIAKKKDPKKSGELLSMGYGFVEYKKAKSADKAIKLLQNTELDGHKLELKKSHRESGSTQMSRKRAHDKKQTTSKILVRNIPFEANLKEVKELFSAFGEIKTLRLPKKMAGTGSHRGFAFVDFLTKQEAKRAFSALCQSTHLYGRRLVLEWADNEESVDSLRQKTAQHFSEEGDSKKKKTSILTSLENTENN